MNNTLKLAYRYEMLAKAAIDPYNSGLRALVISTSPASNILSFKDAANIVIRDLAALDPQNQDAGVTNTNYALMDILNDVRVPDPNMMLNAVNGALKTIQERAKDDVEKRRNAQYLLMLTKYLINKYLVPKTQVVPVQEETTEPVISKETYWKYIERVFKLLRTNTKLEQRDLDTWKTNRAVYINRLEALNAMPERTPAQNDERYSIQFIKGRLG